MLEFLKPLFDTSDFPARWHCGRWTPLHGWIHIISDIAIWGAYMAIPVALAFFVRRRRDVPFTSIFWLFCAFIFSCGTGHLVESMIFWSPVYRLSATVKVATALVSWLTVISIVPIIPRALALPGLARINQMLTKEVAERKYAEHQFRVVVESAPNAFVMIDATGRITLVNAQTENVFGYGRGELIGQPIEILIPERFRSKHPEYRAGFLAAPQARAMGTGRDLYGLRKDGREVPVEIGLNPITVDDRTFVLAAIVDITERKESERKLQQANIELQDKNAEMEQFVYTVSHDLKSPLVTIQGFCGLLLKDLEEDKTECFPEYVEHINRAVSRMTLLIKDVLELSRVGRITYESEYLKLGPILESIAELHSAQLKERGIRLEIQDNMPVIHADRQRIIQVFDNLLVNAITHGYSDNNTCITVGSQECDTEIRLFVRDNGPGIPEKYHERIFELFRRLNPNTDGSGVGLAIVKRIVESHGGRIWVESVPGQATTFWLAFPRSVT